VGSRVSFGRPLDEEGVSDESEVGEPTGKNLLSLHDAAFMDLPYDFGVRTSWQAMFRMLGKISTLTS
jgi:hypothetical protein